MLREEMKKIWRPGPVLVLLITGFVFYKMFLEFYVMYFPNGPLMEGQFDVAAEMVEQYGTALSPAQRDALEQTLPALYAEADASVAACRFARPYGLSTYRELQVFYDIAMEQAEGSGAADQNAMYADAMRIHNYMTSEETGNIEGRIQAVETYLAQYDMAAASDRIIGEKGLSDREKDHILKNFYEKEPVWQNILPAELPETLSLYLGYVLIWQCLSVCLLLSPLPVGDGYNRIRALQWSARTGRSIFRIQQTATLLSAMLLSAVNLLLFAGQFAARGISVFFPCRIYSFMLHTFCWPDWTFGVWCLVLLLLSMLVSTGVAAIVFFLSWHSSGYIAMLLKLIPVFVLVCLFSLQLMPDAFYFKNPLYRLCAVPYVEAGAAAAVFLTGLLLCRWAEKKQKRLELLS